MTGNWGCFDGAALMSEPHVIRTSRRTAGGRRRAAGRSLENVPAGMASGSLRDSWQQS